MHNLRVSPSLFHDDHYDHDDIDGEGDHAKVQHPDREPKPEGEGKKCEEYSISGGIANVRTRSFSRCHKISLRFLSAFAILTNAMDPQQRLRSQPQSQQRRRSQPQSQHQSLELWSATSATRFPTPEIRTLMLATPQRTLGLWRWDGAYETEWYRVFFLTGAPLKITSFFGK